MDEPCSALDVEGTRAIEELMFELKGRYTIVIVTHNMAQARRASDECIFMLLGELIEHAPHRGPLPEPEEPQDRGVHRRPLRLTGAGDVGLQPGARSSARRRYVPLWHRRAPCPGVARSEAANREVAGQPRTRLDCITVVRMALGLTQPHGAP